MTYNIKKYNFGDLYKDLYYICDCHDYAVGFVNLDCNMATSDIHDCKFDDFIENIPEYKWDRLRSKLDNSSASLLDGILIRHNETRKDSI
jgi:hypothetical protein